MKKSFKADSQRILDLMINSIYSNQEIFLRELISNASDALDKYHFEALSNGITPEDLFIKIEVDKEERSIKIIDNGIGMNESELDQNLGTIAESGTMKFKEINKDNEAIGQFGVGFYSSFIVANRVEVLSKKDGSEGYLFSCDSNNEYEIVKANKDNRGTEVKLYFKEDSDDFNYSQFLDSYTIKEIVTKYSDYIRYPIKMLVEHFEPLENEEKEDKKDEEPKTKTVLKEETLNSMIPIWQKKQDEVSKEEKDNFYMAKFHSFQPPFSDNYINVEGLVSYKAMYFIPELNTINQLHDIVKLGFQVYCKGVLILDKEDLLPRHLSFISGVLDTPDLQLNISRELVQQSGQLKKIATNLELRILKDLLTMQSTDREKYQKFYQMYQRVLKAALTDFSITNKDLLTDLLIFNSVNNEGFITLKDYVEKKKEGQTEIYCAYHKNAEIVKTMPEVVNLIEQGYDVLILNDEVDELVLFHVGQYKEMKICPVSALKKENKDDEKIKQLTKDNEVIINKLKEILKDQISDVIISDNLTSAPLCLKSNDPFSLSMEEYIKKSNADFSVKKSLVLNPYHPLFNTLEKVFVKDETLFNDFAYLLLQQARLLEGLSIEKPHELAQKMADLMIKAFN